MAPSPLLSDAGDTGSLNYTVLIPYNESNPTGGDSLKNNLNVHYQVRVELGQQPEPFLWLTFVNCTVRRYCLAPRCDATRVAHDSWSWVSGSRLVLLSCESKLTSRTRFFYSGLARRKSALSLIWLSMMATGVTSFQWFFWGYSLSFSHSAGKFIGDLTNIGFRQVLAAPSVGSGRIPDLLFAVYQGMFAAIT